MVTEPHVGRRALGVREERSGPARGTRALRVEASPSQSQEPGSGGHRGKTEARRQQSHRGQGKRVCREEKEGPSAKGCQDGVLEHRTER